MKKLMFLSCLILFPLTAYPMSIRVDIDVNIMNGDGTINGGDKNDSSEERNESGDATPSEATEESE